MRSSSNRTRPREKRETSLDRPGARLEGRLISLRRPTEGGEIAVVRGDDGTIYTVRSAPMFRVTIGRRRPRRGERVEARCLENGRPAVLVIPRWRSGTAA